MGSGMRNTNKYTKLYFGGTPVFVKDNIFEIVISMENVARLQVGPEEITKRLIEEFEVLSIKDDPNEIYVHWI